MLPPHVRQWQYEADGLHLRQAALPAPGPGQVLLRIGAVALNYRDLLVADTRLADAPPLIPASDACGDVVAVGPGVSRFCLGDRAVSHFIAGWHDGATDYAHAVSHALGGPLPGVLTDYRLFDQNDLVAAPAYLDHASAATLPIAALTAWNALFEGDGLRPGQTVLVQGTGGVSLFALQFALAAGAQVLLLSRSAAKLARASALGDFTAIDTSVTPDWPTQVLAATGGRGVDRIVEVIGGNNLARALQALAWGGTIAWVGFLEGQHTVLPSPPDMLLRQARLHGVMVGHRRAFEAMNRALATHHIAPVIDARYGLDAVPAAFAHLRRGAFGKVVITLD
jgi:NADPH:quinone reductase-like Zn-dependent oxidoreductase